MWFFVNVTKKSIRFVINVMMPIKGSIAPVTRFLLSCLRLMVRIASRELPCLFSSYESQDRLSDISLVWRLSFGGRFLTGLRADSRNAGVPDWCSATYKTGEMLRSMRWAVFDGLVYDLIVISPDTIRQMEYVGLLCLGRWRPYPGVL